MMVDDDVAQAAKDDLEKAIKAYYKIIEVDAYIDAWVLTVHKESIELIQENMSAVGTLTPTAQSFVMTRGLLEISLDGESTNYSD